MAEIKKSIEKELEKIEVKVLHPIAHDGVVFSRGIHKLEAKLAGLFLSLRDPTTHRPIAEKPKAAVEAEGAVSAEPKSGGAPKA